MATEEDPSTEYALPVECLTTFNSEPMTVTVNLDNTPVCMEIDTGAMLSIMNYSIFLSTWPTDRTLELKDSDVRLRTYTGEKIKVKGSLDVQACYEGQEAELTLTIVDGGGPTLLGRDWLRHLRLNWAALNHIADKDRSELKNLLNTHSALFAEGLGRIKGVTARLYLKEGGRP